MVKVYLPDGRYVEAPMIYQRKGIRKARERFLMLSGPIEEGLRYISSTALEIPKGIGLGITQTIGGLTARLRRARAVVPSLTPLKELIR